MKSRARPRHGSGRTQGVEETSNVRKHLNATRKNRRQYKETARVFQKMNEKLDPNSRLRVSNYVKGTKGESNASLDYSGFQCMMKSCKLDDRLSGKEVRTAFDFLSRGGEKVEFSEFRKALDLEWNTQSNNDVSISVPKSKELRQNLIRSARDMMYGRHEANETVIRKLYRNIAGDLRKEIPISEFTYKVREKFDLNEQEAQDLCTACDADCDGFVSLTDFTSSMLASEESNRAGFMVSSRQRSLQRLKHRLERVKVEMSKDMDASMSVTSNSTQKSWVDMRRPDVCSLLFCWSRTLTSHHHHATDTNKATLSKGCHKLVRS